MSKPKVLISGAGPAGTVLAYWLGKNSFTVTLLERSPGNSQSGQIIDIEGPSQEIVRRMGILDDVLEHVTHEAGLTFEDEHKRNLATFPAASIGVSNEIEILRPTLNDIFLKAATGQPGVTIRYGCMITQVAQSQESVTVQIHEKSSDSTTTEKFDLLFICDGLRSHTRNLLLPAQLRDSCIKSLNAFVAFFSLPAEPQDRPYARVCNFPQRRTISIKPLNSKTSSAYLACIGHDSKLSEARQSRNIQLQKEGVMKKFKDCGWECTRLLSGMMETDNFYFEELSQIKLDRWSYGRCVLIGDSAWSPSPLTGQGTNMAILGAYLLASKVVNQPDQPEAAFQEWETQYRPYVNKV